MIVHLQLVRIIDRTSYKALNHCRNTITVAHLPTLILLIVPINQIRNSNTGLQSVACESEPRAGMVDSAANNEITEMSDRKMLTIN